jgi:hypothetical protein
MADTTDPSDAELLKEFAQSLLLDIHTCIPGKVRKYDKASQTCEVLPMVRRPLSREDGSVTHSEYPPLQNVPMGWFASGGFWMQFPVNVGDTVWLMFSEAAWAQWRETRELSDPGDLRRFDLSYPMAIPICRPSADALPALGNFEAAIGVPDGQVLRIGGPSAVAVPLDPALQTELSRIQGDIATLKAATAGICGTLDTATLVGTTYSSAFNGATTATPSAPGVTASSKLKAE